MNSAEILILGKLLLTFGCLLGLPLWELYRLRRNRQSASGLQRPDNGAERL